MLSASREMLVTHAEGGSSMNPLIAYRNSGKSSPAGLKDDDEKSSAGARAIGNNPGGPFLVGLKSDKFNAIAFVRPPRAKL
jgi:hypothetical protein